MSLGFNPTPTVGELHTAGTKTWRWNGIGWERYEMPNTFQTSIKQNWYETLVTTAPTAVDAASTGVLLTYA